MPIVYIRIRKKTCGAELGGASLIAHSIASGGAVYKGKIRKSRDALFVAIVKRACANRGVVVGQAFNGAR